MVRWKDTNDGDRPVRLMSAIALGRAADVAADVAAAAAAAAAAGTAIVQRLQLWTMQS
jgi:hypothetical protein